MITRGGGLPRPQLSYAAPGAGTANPAGSNPVATPVTIFLAAGAPQPSAIVPPNWR